MRPQRQCLKNVSSHLKVIAEMRALVSHSLDINDFKNVTNVVCLHLHELCSDTMW